MKVFFLVPRGVKNYVEDFLGESRDTFFCGLFHGRVCVLRRHLPGARGEG